MSMAELTRKQVLKTIEHEAGGKNDHQRIWQTYRLL